MTPDHDRPGCYIEDTLLLKFLLARYSEMLGMDEPRFDPVWKGLGLVALHQNKELANAFEILISSNSYTVEESLTISIDFFMLELDRLETAETTDYPEKKVERRPLSPRTARKFLFWSWREGRKMSREKDFRFYSVWELVSWLGLSSDEYIQAFEERCRFSEFSTEKKLEQGLEVVKAAIFGRDIGTTCFEHYMLRNGTTPIDKEIQE